MTGRLATVILATIAAAAAVAVVLVLGSGACARFPETLFTAVALAARRPPMGTGVRSLDPN